MGEGRSILRRGAPALLLVSCLALAALPAPGTAASPPEPDWVITSAVTLDRTVKDIRANVRIESGGELRMSNSTLVMNCSKDGEFELLIKPGGRLVAHRANITFGPPRAHYWFRVEGSMELRDSEISGTRGMFDLGGVQITSSDVSILNCRLFDHQWFALVINGSSPAVSGCTIDRCKAGIRVENGARPQLTGNTIRDNERDGITVLSATPVIRDNRLSGNWRGIGLFRSKPEITGNTLSGSGLVGIDCSEGSDAAISGNTITGSGQAGISILTSSPRIASNSITSNGVGINSTSSSCRIEKNTIAANREWGIFSKGGAPVLEANRYTDPAGNPNGLGAVATVWTLSVEVVDSIKKPVPGATVVVKDRSGNEVFRGAPAEDGRVPPIELFQMRSTDGLSSDVSTPHSLRVTWEDLSSSTEVTMDKDRSIRAQLARGSSGGFIPGAWAVLAIAAAALALAFAAFRRR